MVDLNIFENSNLFFFSMFRQSKLVKDLRCVFFLFLGDNSSLTIRLVDVEIFYKPETFLEVRHPVWSAPSIETTQLLDIQSQTETMGCQKFK